VNDQWITYIAVVVALGLAIMAVGLAVAII